MENTIPPTNPAAVYVRRANYPRGSNHRSGFTWPDTGCETVPILDFDAYTFRCTEGYYGYFLDRPQAHPWNGPHWLAFEALGRVRDHGDKVACGQARTLAHGSATRVRQYLRVHGLPVPLVLARECEGLARQRLERVKAAWYALVRGQLAPDARRTGLAGIAYTIALCAAYRCDWRRDSRTTFGLRHTGRTCIDLSTPHWRDVDDETSARHFYWRVNGGESLCPFSVYSAAWYGRWQTGAEKPLPVADYAKKPAVALSRRQPSSRCAVRVNGAIVGWLDTMPAPRKLAKGLDTRKLAKAQEREEEKARKAKTKAQERAKVAIDRYQKTAHRAETLAEKVLKDNGLALVQVAAGWGSWKWELRAPNGAVVGTWSASVGKPDAEAQLSAASRWLTKGY